LTVIRQLLVGLDAMEWDLVRRWADEGKLPAFARLMATGAGGELASTAAQLPDTVWTAALAGVNPGKHGKYYYVQYDPRRCALRWASDDEITAVPLWEHLSRAGHSVGVIDIPRFPLSRSIVGYQINSWGVHAPLTARASNPPELMREIDARFGAHPVGESDAVDDRPGPMRRLRERALDAVRLRGELFRWLMAQHPCEVFIAGFSEPHSIGHLFWHYTERSDSAAAAADQRSLSDTMEQVYRAIDREIGQMIEAAGEGVRVMLFAPHGMGPLQHASWNLPQILELLGYGPTRVPQRKSGSVARRAAINPWRMLRVVLPGRLQYWIRDRMPRPLRERLVFLWYSGGRSWKGRRAFAVPQNDSVGAIRISVRGRDFGGMVQPGEEYEGVCRDISQALGELVDPDTGKPVVKRIGITREEFSGPYLDSLPDLTVLWDQSFNWNSIASPRIGTLRLPIQDVRSGSHTPHGFVIAAGPGIEAGTELRAHSIYDIVPTVLAAAGVPLPAGLDGRIMTALAPTHDRKSSMRA
jgi:predicted AlkP superfamily phosphohydrolase/phosphomutase